MVDDCHATGFLGAAGPRLLRRGQRRAGEVDFVTGTFGKALGGAHGRLHLRQRRCRRPAASSAPGPYLFSNSLPPHVVAAGIKAFDMLAAADDLRGTLAENTAYFREKMTAAGFDVRPGVHPISPVMLYDAPLAQKFAERLLEEGIYAIGFFFPVVPQGKARIRTQISAAHTRQHLDRAIDAFTRIGLELGVIKA
jgi:glycine C-acetyltransferase